MDVDGCGSLKFGEMSDFFEDKRKRSLSLYVLNFFGSKTWNLELILPNSWANTGRYKITN